MKTGSITALQRSRWRLVASATAIALASATFTMAQAQTPAGAGAGMHSAGMGMGMGWGDVGGQGPGAGHAEHMLELAGASADQKAKVRDIFTALRKDLHTQMEAGGGLHAKMGQQLLAPKLDPAAVEALRQQLLAQHDAVSRRVTQAMLDASAVLTPDQRQKLSQAMQQRREMMERHRRERQSLTPQG